MSLVPLEIYGCDTAHSSKAGAEIEARACGVEAHLGRKSCLDSRAI
jgi:hypothetical protein